MTTPAGDGQRWWADPIVWLVLAVFAGAVIFFTDHSTPSPAAKAVPAQVPATLAPAGAAPPAGADPDADSVSSSLGQALPDGFQANDTCIAMPTVRLTAASYNIRSGLGPGHSQRLETFARTLKAIDADVYLLQEVDVNRLWSGQVNQPAYLAKELGYRYAFATNVLRAGDRRYGTAILSRYPIAGYRNVGLPNAAGKQQRGLLRAEIDVNGVRIAAYTTHLEHTSYALRQAQATAIASVLAKDPLPALMGGDFNSVPGSLTMATVRKVATDTWATVGQGAGLTHPAGNPHKRIDYLFSRGVVPVAAKVVETRVSDHRPVLAAYEIPTGTAPKVCLPQLAE